MIERIDDLYRTVRLAAAATRVVCLVPSITDTLFTFGAGDRLVGITDYCIHPAAGVGTVRKIGGTKNFDTAAVVSLKPDLVIANAEENRKAHVERLEAAGLPVFVTFPKDVDGCLKMMADVAALTGTEEAAGPVLAEISEARRENGGRSVSRRPRVLCPIWKEPWMTVNRDTFVHSVIGECGGDNIFADLEERYPRFALEEASRHAPEVILLPTEPFRFSESDAVEIATLLNESPAAREGRIHIVEGELLSWYGPRVARALRELPRLLPGCQP